MNHFKVLSFECSVFLVSKIQILCQTLGGRWSHALYLILVWVALVGHWTQRSTIYKCLRACVFVCVRTLRGSQADLLTHYTNHIKLSTCFRKIWFLCSNSVSSSHPCCFSLPVSRSKLSLPIGSSPAKCEGQVSCVHRLHAEQLSHAQLCIHHAVLLTRVHNIWQRINYAGKDISRYMQMWYMLVK